VINILTGEARDLTDRASRPQSLIITIYGAFSRKNGNWFSGQSIVQLCFELDVNEDATRSALARFKKRGILISKKVNGINGYALSLNVKKTFEQGDARVLTRRVPPINQGWILVAFSIPEETRAIRYQLRSRLLRIGFAQVTGGLWVAPLQLCDDAILLAKTLKIENYMSIFSAEHLAFKPTVQAVAEWWDLEGIAEVYKSFNATAKPVLNSWARRRTHPDPKLAFVDYTKILTNWRHVPYFDPGLPREYLPKNWAGYEATETFFGIHDRLSGPALNFALNVAKNS